MQQRKALKTQPRCTQQSDYALPTPTGNITEAPELETSAITDEMVVPKGVRYGGVPLYYNIIYKLL